MSYGTTGEQSEKEKARDDELTLVAAILKRFKVAADADQKQRELELDDLRFCDDPEGQWLKEHRDARRAGIEGGIAVAARPCLTINQVKPSVQQVANEARNARLSIQVNPKGDGASQQTAEIIKGLYRNIEVESRASMARMRALTRAIKCGRGYYRILKAYANDGDDDLDITIEPILNQHQVFLDPFHQKPDGSDALEAWIVADVEFERYKKLHPKSKLASCEEGELAALGASAPDWVGGDRYARAVRIAEYFEVEITEAPAKKSQKERKVEQRKVIWRKINCYEVLEQSEWEGRYIPIVQVVGDEANINGERSYSGIVRNAKDANRVYNVMASEEMSAIGLSSKAPWIVAEGQVDNYKQIWSQAHIKSFAWLPYTPKTFAGELAPPPQRNVAEPAIQAISLSRRHSREDVQTTTNTYDPNVGKGEPGDSGRKVLALQAQGQHGNSHFLTDFADVSMTHEANIIIDLMPHVYDRPGRVVKILTGDDDTAESVMLNKPYMQGQDGEPAAVEGGNLPPGAKQYFLGKGRYSVTATVGKSFTTQHEEADAMFTALAQASPESMPIFADLWIRSRDMPYGDELADRFKKLLPPQLQDEQNQQQDPAQLQAQIGQLTMALQQAQAEAQDAQAGIAKAKIDAESREKIKGAELENKSAIEQMKAQLAEMKIMVDASIAKQKLDADIAKTVMTQNREDERHAQDLQHADSQQHQSMVHEQAMRSADVGREAAGQDADLTHQRGMADTTRVHQTSEAQADRAHTERVAKMPKPSSGKAK